jgi:acetyltransferase EpsM
MVILGGPGIGIIIAQAIAAAASAGTAAELSGYLNDKEPTGTLFAGFPVLGSFEHWRACDPGTQFISAFHKAKHAQDRLDRILSLGIPAERWATVAHPLSCIGADVIIAQGSYVGPFAVLEPGLIGGAHLCLRGGCYVSHDVRLGDYVFVGPNASVLSHCDLGTGVHVGANAVCREQVTIGRYAVIGAGAVVVEDVAEFAIVAGNPARPIGRVPVVA